MALTIKGIEAAKPKTDKATGKAKLVRLAGGNGLFLEVAETSTLSGLGRCTGAWMGVGS